MKRRKIKEVSYNKVMAKCPVCSAEIEDDFGLVTCAKCGSPVMLELEGVVSAASVVSTDSADSTDSTNDSLPPLQEIPTTPDMSDVVDFGNSEISQGNEGLLRFNIYIGGIDTADIRKQVYEIIADARFLWDADKIMTDLHQGELIIKEITAVKSALLVQRLRTISIDIHWEQYAIHQL
ncbi:MAG: hypothetical protein A2Z20_04320 [Bdellovibrionales bacterium RBG_16_40_8]|nr:MAG: hypothetical protein A2Z20_04320 [Bdellovibrionales bacterium RBG_16_40_8]